MGTGQMLLTMSAMMLLSMLILRTNNSFLITNSLLYDTKFEVLAVSLGTSIIEEANSKAFDAVTDTASVSSTSELTIVSLLGPETGETYENYNDFDDFDGYTRVDTSMPSANFNITCQVDYVSDANPDGALSTASWNKKITVYVTSASMTDTVTMSSIYSYWFFR